MLKLIIGSVNSNKNLLLKKYVDNELLSIRKPIIYYPADSNKNKNSYKSDNGTTYRSYKIFDYSDLYGNIGESSILFIDEVQFIVSRPHINEFMKFLEFCDTQYISVYMFGLNLDYSGEPFEVISRIIQYVDELELCTSYCEKCGKPANMSIRYVCGVPDIDQNSDTQMLESELITYKPVCRQCFRSITGAEVIK